MKDINRPMHYIRKNRATEAMIYLKENERKAAQRLFCHIYAADHNINILGETTSLDEIKDCDVMLIASASMLTRDEKEYYKIERGLKEKGIRIEIAVNDGNAERYIDMITNLHLKGRI